MGRAWLLALYFAVTDLLLAGGAAGAVAVVWAAARSGTARVCGPFGSQDRLSMVSPWYNDSTDNYCDAAHSKARVVAHYKTKINERVSHAQRRSPLTLPWEPFPEASA